MWSVGNSQGAVDNVQPVTKPLFKQHAENFMVSDNISAHWNNADLASQLLSLLWWHAIWPPHTRTHTHTHTHTQSIKHGLISIVTCNLLIELT